MWWYWVTDVGGVRTALDVAFEARTAREFEALALKTASEARQSSYDASFHFYPMLSLSALDEKNRKVYPAGGLPPRTTNENGKLRTDPRYPDDDETIIREHAGLWWEKAEFAFSFREELHDPP